MSQARAEITLKWLLRIVASVGAAAFLCVFLPYSWMNSTHAWLGLNSLPSEPIVGYLARSLSAMYAFVSGVFWIASCDVQRYIALVRFLGIATAILGALLVGIGFTENLPTLWTLTEGPPSIVYGCAIVWLARFVNETGPSK